MIACYRFAVLTDEKLYSSKAYAFYSCLQTMLPPDTADWLHEQGETPVSQFLRFDRVQNQLVWQISLLGQAAVSALSPVLDTLEILELNTGRIALRLLGKEQISAEDLIARSQQKTTAPRTELLFLTPTAFRQNGAYVVLPIEKLILQSLVNKWNAVFPKYPLDDADAFTLILDKLRIVDYSLRTSRYLLKSVYIPGFSGSLAISAPLPAPMMEIWNLLASFSAYSGIGIKTALGMGGVAAQPVE